MRRRGVWVVGGLAAVGLCAGLAVWATWPASPPAPDWSADYDLTTRPPETIPPGTVVDRTAPPGWSHLVVKSLPRVRADQHTAFPRFSRGLAVRMASWMFTAFLADVTPEQHAGHTRHRLRAVALGLGTSLNGRDTIITPETAEQFKVGDLGEEILTKGYEVQRKAVLVVHGPSMGLLDTPVWFRCGDDHKLVRYRYALLVEDPGGKLDVLVWRLEPEAGTCGGLAEAVRLAPDTIDEAELVVDRRKVDGLGRPSDDAFAVEKMPPGRPVPVPPDLRPLAAQTRFTADEARDLEARLRKLTPETPAP